MKNILYVHGLGSGAESNSARLIRKHLPESYNVDAPEIPQDPIEAHNFLVSVQNNYDLVVGSSLGGFYTFILFSTIKKLLINPTVYPAKYIKEKIGLGEYEYFSKRENGDRTFVIDEEYIKKLEALTKHYYSDCLDEEVRAITRCIVSPEDELLGSENYDNCKKLLYNDMVIKSYGGHRLTEEIVTKFVVPEIIYMTENFVAHSSPCARDGPERREPGFFEKGVPYSERLKTYLEYSRSRGNNEFAERTCGICATATFRKCLKDYIKSFEPQKIFSDSEARISLHSDGVFAIEGENKGGANLEGEDGKTSFYLEILSYFNITCFWEELEKIRNFNYIKRPIVIAGIDSGDLSTIEALSHGVLRERSIIYVAESLPEHL